MLPRSFSRNLPAAALLAGMAWFWVALAPSQFGGQAAYVMVAGASMEPTLHQGDLVVVRQAQTYAVGDIATYRHPNVGPVIHRIVEREGDRFVLQGDNNDWLDSYEPTTTEIVGKAWLVVPQGALWLQRLRSPAGLAVLSIALAMILLITVRSSGRGEQSDPMSTTRSEATPATRRGPEDLDGPVFALAAVGLGALILVLVAFSRPTQVAVPQDIPFSHTAAFAYHAGGPASVYAGGEIRSGDPVFHQLVPEFQIDFRYRFESPAAGTVTGTSGMDLELSEPNGWRRTLVLQPAAPFSGREVSLTGVVDLALVRQAIALLEERTTLDRQAYSVDIIPWVQLEGELDGQPLSTHFSPDLAFTLDDLELYMRQGDPLSDLDPLHPTASGFISSTGLVASEITILGLVLTVEAARWIGSLGLAVCLAAFFVLAAPAVRAYRAGGYQRARLEYGARTIDARSAPAVRTESLVEVASVYDLGRLSERTGRTILHVVMAGEHHFYLEDGGLTYHAVADDAQDRSGQAAEERPAG